MCGVAGRIDKMSDRLEPLSATSKEFRAIERRGPDRQHIRSFDCSGHHVSLAHSRLSVIDLSELGDQPMLDEISGWWISYNGEIYNYLEIREELRAHGWSFRSGSDTEVVLKAWAQWGLNALSRFNGMFALAMFRPVSGELWLIRDRFGVKPLSWGTLLDGGMVFSSSIAGVASEVGEEIDIDYCARGLRYKVFETARSGSPFKKVKTVPAGGWVKIQLTDLGLSVKEGQWYDLAQAVRAKSHAMQDKTDNELLEQCTALLDDAVRVRLRSDVPVAVSLSGGLDSSSIAALASRRVEGLRGFTYGAPDAASSEGPEVKVFSSAVGVGVTFVWPDFAGKDLGDALERTLAFQEAPFSGLSLLAQNEVYRTTRQAGFKVLLGGQGGDELFAGYRKFFVVALREAMNKREPEKLLHLLYSLGLMMAHEASQARMYWQNLKRYGYKSDSAFKLLDWKPAIENLWGDTGISLSGRQMEDIQQWSLPTLLRYEDRNSMGYGVESRLPFMDYRLLELALALPTRLKISNGYGKWALRKVTAGVVPDAIRLNRKKRGFDVTQGWIREGIGSALRSNLLDNLSMVSPYLRPGINLRSMLSDHALSQDGDLLDEALMLAWLVQPIRTVSASNGLRQ